MNKEEMTKEIAVEIATKYANDIWLFGEVDKYCVSEVCKVLLSELDIANKKLEKFEWYEMNAETLIESNKILQHEKKDLIKYCENERNIISTQVENTEYGRFIALGEILNKLKGDDK